LHSVQTDFVSWAKWWFFQRDQIWLPAWLPEVRSAAHSTLCPLIKDRQAFFRQIHQNFPILVNCTYVQSLVSFGGSLTVWL
jgi:hypothetical protein